MLIFSFKPGFAFEFKLVLELELVLALALFVSALLFFLLPSAIPIASIKERLNSAARKPAALMPRAALAVSSPALSFSNDVGAGLVALLGAPVIEVIGEGEGEGEGAEESEGLFAEGSRAGETGKSTSVTCSELGASQGLQ